jgi:7-cyano-7-deazaguanine synthase
MHTFSKQNALALFSGGQDSTICLFWALNRFARVFTVGFDYDQCHGVEMQCRSIILETIPRLRPTWQNRLGPDTVLDLKIMGQLADSSLLRAGTAPSTEKEAGRELPDTFVPGRNLLFIISAAALAFKLGCGHLILGVSETDYSGYPDCRDDTIKAMQTTVNLGMGTRLILHTPLMWLNKAQTWLLARTEGMIDQKNGNDLVELVRVQTHSCYLGIRTHPYPWGYGCGECAACILRAKGFAEYERLYAETPECPLL